MEVNAVAKVVTVVATKMFNRKFRHNGPGHALHAVCYRAVPEALDSARQSPLPYFNQRK